MTLLNIKLKYHCLSLIQKVFTALSLRASDGQSSIPKPFHLTVFTCQLPKYHLAVVIMSWQPYRPLISAYSLLNYRSYDLLRTPQPWLNKWTVRAKWRTPVWRLQGQGIFLRTVALSRTVVPELTVLLLLLYKSSRIIKSQNFCTNLSRVFPSHDLKQPCNHRGTQSLFSNNAFLCYY